MPDVEIRAERPDHPLVAPLLQALDAYLYQQYPVRLEATVRAQGVERIFLETGTRQPEALRLYQRCGYVTCPPFGDYTLGPVSVFMEKQP